MNITIFKKNPSFCQFRERATMWPKLAKINQLKERREVDERYHFRSSGVLRVPEEEIRDVSGRRWLSSKHLPFWWRVKKELTTQNSSICCSKIGVIPRLYSSYKFVSDLYLCFFFPSNVVMRKQKFISLFNISFLLLFFL